METLKLQVRRARRRLVMQQYLGAATWCLFATLLVAALAIGARKLWVFNVDVEIWKWSWIGGAVGVGLLAAAVWTFVIRRGSLDAALEIDRRFGLKERISSTLALGPEDLDSEAGRALMSDAVRRVERIDVREKFSVRAGWYNLLPLIPAAAVFVLVLFVADAVQKNDAAAGQTPVEIKKQVERSTEELKKRLAERRKLAEELGLKDAEEEFRKLEQGLDKMKDKDLADRKQALSALNDLAKELKEKRESLGDSQQMKNQFNQLKDLDKGPADKVAKALKDGDLQKAIDEIKNLQDQLKNNQLNDEQKKQLANQMQQMADKMREMANAHEQMKEDLQKQIDQKMQQGDQAGAGKLQQQLDRLNQQNNQMQQMQQMANKLGQAAQSMKDGNMQDAGQQLQQMAGDLQDLKEQLDQIQMLDDALDQLAGAKDAMNCPQCNGAGCEACMGMGGFGQGMGQGNGLGEGQGQGDRPEQETDTKTYDSQVRGNIGRGTAVVTDQVGGPNVAGQARETIKANIEAATTQSADPLTGQRLPREQREHARQYFDSFRDGE